MGSLEGVPYVESISDEGKLRCCCSISAFAAQSLPKVAQDFFYDVESPPLPASSGDPQAESNYTDGSGALFSMYLNRAEEEDKETAERWKGDADGILVFVSCCGTCNIYHRVTH